MCATLLKEAADGAENLKVVGDSCVVERKRHGVSLPSLCLFLRMRYIPRNFHRLQSAVRKTDAPSGRGSSHFDVFRLHRTRALARHSTCLTENRQNRSANAFAV